MNYKIPRSLIRKGSRHERYVVELIKRLINTANSRDGRRHPLIRRRKSYGSDSASVTYLDVMQVTSPTGSVFNNLGQKTIEYRIEASQHDKNRTKVVVHASVPVTINGNRPSSIDVRIMELVGQGLVSHHYTKSGTGPYTYKRIY